LFLAAVATMAVFVASPFGASVRGTRDQPRRMNALGYHVWMIRFLAFLFSGFWSGVAGLLYLYYNQFVSPQAVALTASAEALLMVISGGTATLLGPIVGAGLVVIVKNVASAYIERWNFVLGAIFVVIVVFMPDGLVPGTRRLWRWAVAALRPREAAVEGERQSRRAAWGAPQGDYNHRSASVSNRRKSSKFFLRIRITTFRVDAGVLVDDDVAESVISTMTRPRSGDSRPACTRISNVSAYVEGARRARSERTWLTTSRHASIAI